jgi:hypothetical protein
VTVIVSEETGRISLAIEGSIESDLTADGLRLRLRELLTAKRRESREVSRPVFE